MSLYPLEAESRQMRLGGVGKGARGGGNWVLFDTVGGFLLVNLVAGVRLDLI